jgi:VWFA-related protein
MRLPPPVLALLAVAPVVTLGLAAAGMTSPAPQAAPAPEVPQAGPTVGVTASRVAVDLVVRDKKGRLVRDLEASEIDVLEDGAPQEVLSVRFVDAVGGARALPQGPPARPPSAAPAASAPGAGPGPAAAPQADEHPLFLAFLFDRLSPQARRNAYDAAVEWLRRPAPAKRYVGVFRIDQTLETLRPFSDDEKGAVEAVHLILESAPTAYASRSDREKLRGLRLTMLGLAGAGSPAAAAGSVPAEFAGLEVGAQDLASGTVGQWQRSIAYFKLRAEVAMLEASEALERDQQGLTTVNSVLALVNGLKTAPGRKAVVFFSEGLVLPPRVISALRSAIAEANRSGITFYTADAAGLRTVSAADEARRELAAIQEEIRQGERTPAGGPGAGPQPSRPLTKALERNEDILRSDPKSGLGTLARETGGFMVSDTNEIAKSLRVAEEDLASYYLLEYAPSNELWDGRFRRIEVKVRRKDVHVQARQGYFAVRTPMPTPLLDYESPVLAALEMAPRARDLAFATAVVQVPDQADESAVPVLVEVAGDVPTLDLDAKEKRYRQDFTVLVLARDEGGRVVRKLSRRFATAGPLEKAEEARKARVLVLRETWLAPGRYTVEVAVQDAASGRLGVQRTPLEVAATPGSLRVGTLVVVGHAAPRGEGPAEAPALVTQGLQIYPSASGPVSASAGRPLPFFLVASPVAGREALRATVELRQGETPVFAAPAEMTAAIGRSTLLGGVPLDGVAPGEYELRVTVADGVDRAVRWAKVTIGP